MESKQFSIFYLTDSNRTSDVRLQNTGRLTAMLVVRRWEMISALSPPISNGIALLVRVRVLMGLRHTLDHDSTKG
jgi:hypothetical protein